MLQAVIVPYSFIQTGQLKNERFLFSDRLQLWQILKVILPLEPWWPLWARGMFASATVKLQIDLEIRFIIWHRERILLTLIKTRPLWMTGCSVIHSDLRRWYKTCIHWKWNGNVTGSDLIFKRDQAVYSDIRNGIKVKGYISERGIICFYSTNC